RLDRALASSRWLQVFPNTSIHHLSFGGSDHAPLWVECAAPIRRPRQRHQRRFRFEARWMSIPVCESVIREAWRSTQGRPFALLPNLSSTRVSLLRWYQHQIGPVKNNIKRVESKLASLAINTLDDSAVAKEKQLRGELAGLLLQEEVFWMQRSKTHWLAKGDRNTAYFHACASARRDRNRISIVIDSEGRQQNSPEGIKMAFSDYFTKIFSSTSPNPKMLLRATQSVTISLTDAIRESLSSPFTKEEIWPALKQMKPLSSPGPDGFPPVFF
ncbi:hypothetical protein M569_12826, partial [Genlisea aurea]